MPKPTWLVNYRADMRFDICFGRLEVAFVRERLFRVFVDRSNWIGISYSNATRTLNALRAGQIKWGEIK